MPTITGPNQESNGLTITSAVAHQFTFTVENTGSVVPASMLIFLDGQQVALIDHQAKYITKTFTFTPVGGSPISGVFVDGPVYLVSVTAAPTTGAPTTPGPNSSGVVKNNGGIIKRGGNVPEARKFTVTPVVHANERQVIGSVVVDNNSANKAVNAGVFANNTQRPIARKVTTVLGGVSNTVLRSGAARPELVKSINKLETLRTRRFTTAIRENKYNRVTGRFDVGYPVVGVDNLATDNAANPTRSNPGQMVYKIGGQVPVTSNYKPKTN